MKKKAVLLHYSYKTFFRRSSKLCCWRSSGTLNDMLVNLSPFVMIPDWPIGVLNTRNKRLNLGINWYDAYFEITHDWEFYRHNRSWCQFVAPVFFSDYFMVCRERQNGIFIRYVPLQKLVLRGEIPIDARKYRKENSTEWCPFIFWQAVWWPLSKSLSLVAISRGWGRNRKCYVPPSTGCCLAKMVGPKGIYRQNCTAECALADEELA